MQLRGHPILSIIEKGKRKRKRRQRKAQEQGIWEKYVAPCENGVEDDQVKPGLGVASGSHDLLGVT